MRNASPPTPTDAALLQTATRAREADGAVLVEVAQVSWPHPHEPATRWVTVTRLPLPAEPATVDAARAKLLRSRRYFGVCAECGERHLRGHMFGRDLCAGCAERVLQVRF
ncbi:hypothetical protein [Crenobacter intestini]|uniref:Uncharacterized protein n=1 Tax=Crenobacter intestini TaxID=2563443 RepID=A0A4V4N8T5_9NEIS|nr:hypothetical protein [Crenobacter intestini]TIC85193.1 hypothetical protein E5K04_04115 [Crenobacter intestini]